MSTSHIFFTFSLTKSPKLVFLHWCCIPKGSLQAEWQHRPPISPSDSRSVRQTVPYLLPIVHFRRVGPASLSCSDNQRFQASRASSPQGSCRKNDHLPRARGPRVGSQPHHMWAAGPERIANLRTLPFLHRVVMRITQKHKKGLEDSLTYRKCSTKIHFIMVTATTAMD